MSISHTPAIERIARVLAGITLSSNADGGDPHAGDAVNMEWPDHVEQAIAILTTLREPDNDMAAAGDVEIWKSMIAAAIGEPYDAPRPEDIQGHTDSQSFRLSEEQKLEDSLVDSMDGSDPPSVTQPGHHGEPVPSSGFKEPYKRDTSRGHRPVSGSGAVSGNDADAGGTGVSDEDYDSDAAGGSVQPESIGSEHRREHGAQGTASDIIIPER